MADLLDNTEGAVKQLQFRGLRNLAKLDERLTYGAGRDRGRRGGHMGGIAVVAQTMEKQ